MEYSVRLVVQGFGNDRLMRALVHFARVAEVAVVKRVLQNERDLRNMDALIAAREYTSVLEQGSEVVERRGAGGIKLEYFAHELCVLTMDGNRLCARVVQVSERREAGIYSLPRFLPQAAGGVRGELPDILIRHTELHRHHEHVIVGEVRAVVRADMANDTLLQKPLYLPAVHRISREPVNLPADDSLRLAAFNAAHHIAEKWAAGHFRASLFYKLIGNFQLLASRERAKFHQLRLNRENLLVLDIGAFAYIQKIMHRCII